MHKGIMTFEELCDKLYKIKYPDRCCLGVISDNKKRSEIEIELYWKKYVIHYCKQTKLYTIQLEEYELIFEGRIGFLRVPRKAICNPTKNPNKILKIINALKECEDETTN